MRMSQYETEQLLKFIDAMFPDWKCIMDRGPVARKVLLHI